MSTLPCWGVVATIKAKTEDTLQFVAHYLEAGARLVHVFLDVPDPDAEAILRGHPQCRVTLCDADYWQELCGNRPERIEPRQSANASFAYAQSAELDWLLHVDVDEFIVAGTPLANTLGALPENVHCLRVRPMEALVREDGEFPTAYKDFMPANGRRQALAKTLYPTYGAYMRAGFLSHIGGKLFIRSGLTGVRIRIHNAFRNGVMISEESENAGMRLAHVHTTSWADWRATLPFRLQHGSYRQGLKPAQHAEIGAVGLHDLFTVLQQDEGDAGLRAFFQEVCTDTPELRARLAAAGLLVETDLNLPEKRATVFGCY